MAEQLWKGRFSKAVDSRVNDFNSSIRFDQRMIAQDMRGSGVHAAMLAKQGIISEKDCEDILSGLASIADDLASGTLTIDPNAEDVHTFVEQTLTARIGDAGKRLHTGRSRNDQVALDIRLTLRDYSHTLQAYIVELVKVICRKAAENTTAVMPGYTHLQRAQPITFGHALMAYAWMLLRDLQRFEDATARMDAQCPLGSGALAGTTYPLDRQFTAEKLGFAAPCPNSLDGVSDRDFCIELANAISICMMHLSRLSEEIILWCSWEFKFIELDDAFTPDAAVSPALLEKALKTVVPGTYNQMSVDLDTSTNDTLIIMASGLAGNPEITEENADYHAFVAALTAIAEHMCAEHAGDGEGATHLITCEVTHAPDLKTARAVSRSVVCSNLFKAAVFGRDANWGRILCAIGYTPGDFSIDKVCVWLSSAAGEVYVCENAAYHPYSEDEAAKVLAEHDILVKVDMGTGDASAKAWGCDLTYDYVKINGDYRT